MPYKKEKLIESLQRLCMDKVLDVFDDLKNRMGCLPYMLRDELAVKSVDYSLPSDIFIHPKKEKIDCITYSGGTVGYDLPIGQFLDRIGSICKNLTHLKLIDEDDSITFEDFEKLISNISQIRSLAIRSKAIKDSILLQIGSHCSELQNLDLSGCRGITDDGIIDLLTTENTLRSRNLKIVILNITSTSVTAAGCVTALRKLPFLKELYHDLHHISEVFLLLRRDTHANGFENASPMNSIEYFKHFKFTNEPDLKIATILFPNLRKISIGEELEQSRLVRLIPKFRQLEQLCIVSKSTVILNNLLPKLSERITDLNLGYLDSFDIKAIGYFCPMLEYLFLCGKPATSDSMYNWLSMETCPHVPFSHLRTLALGSESERINRNDFRQMLTNAEKLENLKLMSCPVFSDELLANVIASNKLLHLKSFSLSKCDSCTVYSVLALLELNNPLKDIIISECAHIEKSSYSVLLKNIRRNKLDVNLVINERFLT